jgi:hypothetical protein
MGAPEVRAFDRERGELVLLRPDLGSQPYRRVRRQAGDEREQPPAAGGRDLRGEVQAVVPLEVGLDQVPAFR